MTHADPDSLAVRAATPGSAAPGQSSRPPRRRYFTGDARRPWRVCRFPRPINGEDSDPAYCRCGGVLDRFADPWKGLRWRHRPTRRRVPIAMEPVR